MTTKHINICSFNLPTLNAIFELFKRLGWDYDWEDEYKGKLIVNIPIDDWELWDLVTNGF